MLNVAENWHHVRHQQFSIQHFNIRPRTIQLTRRHQQASLKRRRRFTAANAEPLMYRPLTLLQPCGSGEPQDPRAGGKSAIGVAPCEMRIRPPIRAAA